VLKLPSLWEPKPCGSTSAFAQEPINVQRFSPELPNDRCGTT
jgi:hypothetical protein